MRRALAPLGLALFLHGCPPPAPTGPLRLSAAHPWEEANRRALDALLTRSDLPAVPGQKPVAAFDWDNTVIKNDIGDATFFWMLRHDKFLRPARWEETSPFLAPAAAAALGSACDGLAAPGQALPTATHAACTDELLTIYLDGTTAAGLPAWRGTWNHRRLEPSYAWAAQLHAGYRPEEIRAFAEATLTEALAAPVGATQAVGSRQGLAGYIRIYEQMKDLIHALDHNGVAVWVVSASPQYVVETFAARVGVPRERVIGIRQVEAEDGTLRARLQGCGDVAEGTDGVITYMDGKRCWINKVIYGDISPNAFTPRTDPAYRPIFAAGDADTDVSFLEDAGLRLVIDRHKKEITCRARTNADGGWLLQPMFIEPRAAQPDEPACPPDACLREDGTRGACN